VPYTFLKGIKTKNKLEVFPASPTIVKILVDDKALASHFMQQRKALLNKKKNHTNAPIYDERLRPYQNAEVDFLINFKKGKGVFDQQRVGKTPITLVTMRELNQNKCLILVPKSNIHKWIQEYKKWHGGPCYTTTDWYPPQRRKEEYSQNLGTLITNYEKLIQDYDEIIESFGSFDAIIVDEAHMLRNYKGLSFKISGKDKEDNPIKKYKSPEVTRAIMETRSLAKDAYALTGTPAPTAQHNVFGILAFLFPDLFSSYNKAMNYYFNRKTFDLKDQNIKFSTIGKFQNKFKEKEFVEFLETFSVQTKRKDVMKWIPEVDEEIFILEPSPNVVKWHEELHKYFETEDIICPDQLSVMTRERQLSTYPRILGLNDDGPKFKWIKNHIKDYPNTPLIIAGAFTEILKALQTYLKDDKRVRIMHGGTSSKNRKKLEDDFQAGEYDILIGNIKVISLGLTLSRAEEIILLDPSLTQADNEQVLDRFIPTTPEEAEAKEGQTIIRLLSKDTIDEYIAKQLQRRKTENDIINDYTRTLIKHAKL